MIWSHYLAFFFGGAFGANAVPHVVAGTLGRAFQTPFAKPPGEGLSSSTVNVLWGALNLAASYLLFVHVGDFSPHDWTHAGAAAAGGLLLSVHAARHFGRFHGGNERKR